MGPGRGEGGSRLGGCFVFDGGSETCPPLTRAQRLFRRAWTTDDEEMMEIYLESQLGGGAGGLPLRQAVRWIRIVEG